MTTIVGIDFSGAKEDRNTWITSGRLDGDGRLTLDYAQPIRRDDLYKLLLDFRTPAVAAMDFPFGVPARFAEHICHGVPPTAMPEVWRSVLKLELDEFVGTRNAFIAARAHLPAAEREPRRAGDRTHHPESYSPLHNVNPNMLPMTYLGMRMMGRWHQEHQTRWHVPPLPPAGPYSKTVTLLEMMPGAFLKSIGLPFKGYKSGRRSLELRDRICDGLPTASGVAVPNLDSVRLACRANDDCLDSVVAAVGAAAWAMDPRRFHHPNRDELAKARLEGWIYVPMRGEAGDSV